jgi:hypothetical protein
MICETIPVSRGYFSIEMNRSLNAMRMVILVLSVCCTQLGAAPSSTTELSTQVQVCVISQIPEMVSEAGNSNAYLSASDEFRAFSAVMGKVLADELPGVDWVIKRFPSRLNVGAVGLSLYLHEWRVHVSGVVQVRFSVQWHHEGGSTESLGVFRGRSTMPAVPVRSLRDRALDQAVERAVLDLAVELQLRLQGKFSAVGEGPEEKVHDSGG